MNKELNLNQIHNEEIRILKEIQMFLKKHNIKYFAFYGTLLGAVRHKGFIPWDDDIDIVILREDYNELIKILKENDNVLNKNIKAIGFELNNADWPFLKIINTDIEVIDKHKTDKNLWVDIFPLDNLPSKNPKLFLKKINIIRKVFLIKRDQLNNIKRDNTTWLKSMLWEISKKITAFLKYDSITKFLIKESSKFSNIRSNLVADVIWGFSNNHIFDKSFFENTVKLPFENIEVDSTMNFEECLSIQYGNYMELPPKEKRATHSFKAIKIGDNNEK